MSDSLDQQLLGHLLGALEDDEQEALDARLEHDERCCRLLAGWRRRLGSLETMRPDFEPPRGLAERTCRYVAARISAAPSPASVPHMTPEPAVSGLTSAVRWPDLVAATLVLLMATALVFPAISHSRFQSRLASCQAALRQIGLALSQYGDRQQLPVVQLASGGRLTPSGTLAVQRLRDELSGDSPRQLCPDAWLAIQGVSGKLPHTSALSRPTNANWLGTRRDGTDDEWQLPLTAAPSPLLADAPSADLPGQALVSHAGRGRNVLFDDGHAAFVPVVSAARADWVLSRAGGVPDAGDPVMLHLTSGR